VCYFFGINKLWSTLETHSTKVSEVGESNKAEVLTAGAQRGLGGEARDVAAILELFSQTYAFLGVFWSKFLLKTAFLNG